MSLWGLLGAVSISVSSGWLYGELLYLVGCTFLLIRDWNKFSLTEIPENKGLSSRLKNKSSKSFTLYRFWVIITFVLGFTAFCFGLTGDQRLSTSVPKKVIDIISSAILAGKTFEYEVVMNNIRPIEKIYLFSNFISATLLGVSKSAGLPALLWACQRWLNPSSPLFAMKKIIQIKLRLAPICAIILTVIMAYLIALRGTGGGTENFLYNITTRLERNFDIYIFLDSLPQSKVVQIFSESGGWIGALFGGINNQIYNIGSLAKAYAINRVPDATGANPRLFSLIIAMNGLNNISIMITVSIACIEIWCLSKLRKLQFKHSSNKSTAIFNFFGLTSLVNSFNTDVSTLKYSLITVILGNIILRIKTTSESQAPFGNCNNK